MGSDIHTIGTANKKAVDIRIEIHVVQTRFNSSEKRVFGANSWWKRELHILHKADEETFDTRQHLLQKHHID
jgi:hypothetical protein